MAKPSATAKATAAKKAAEAKAKKEAAQAKAMKQLESVETGKTNLPVIIEAKAEEHDVTIPLSAPYEDGYANKAATERRFKATEEQLKFVEQLVDRADFNVAIVEITREVATMQWKLAAFCVAIAAKLQKEGVKSIDVANEFIKALRPLGKQYTFIRVNAIIQWLEAYAPVEYGSKAKGEEKQLLYSSSKRQAQSQQFGRNPRKWKAERLNVPFWVHKPEPELGEYDLANVLNDAFKKAEKYNKYTPEERKAKFKKLNIPASILDGLRELVRQANHLPEEKADDNSGEQSVELQDAA